MKRTFITKEKSKKTGKEFTALIGISNNDKRYYLSFDRMTMLRLSNMTLADFENIAVGDEIDV